MDKNKIQIMALALFALMTLAVAIVMFQLGAIASAQERGSAQNASVAGVTATLLHDQGRLADPHS